MAFTKKSPPLSPTEQIYIHSCVRPKQPAISAWDGTITYFELHQLTSQWANHLQRLGVHSGTMVPILMAHSKWAVVAELAILKAGGAFVPIDPSQPVERLRGIIAQVRAKVVLSSAQSVDKISPCFTGTVVIMSDQATSALLEGQADDLTPTSPESPAYIIFTSGSTGKPKGCVVSRASLSDVANQYTALKIESRSRVLQFASYSFGVSLIEIYGSLAAGATICIPSQESRLNTLADFAHEMQISWAILTPSTAMSMIRIPQYMKTLVLAGESMSEELLNTWAPKVNLLQGLGFTEWAGICCVSPRITSPADIRALGTSPTAEIWLVDPKDHNQLAPTGAVAELVVRGPALATGYLDDISQTERAFIKNPAWYQVADAGKYASSTFYKTGDLVQIREGSVQYVGRKDMQVKIRGKRVELREVEHHIRKAYPSTKNTIAEASVPADGNGLPILVAFLYFQGDASLSMRLFTEAVPVIKQSLEQTIPDYMRPSVYIPLESVPLTITGKIDRQALRSIIRTSTRKELEERNPSQASHIIAPTTPMENELHSLFAEVLKIEPSSFGIHHSFSALGGDSVSAMRLVNRCRKNGTKVTVPAILQQQTIAKLARQFGKTKADQPICNGPYTGPIEQSFAQGRLWFLEKLNPGLAYALPFATRFKGDLRIDALEAALSALEERHESLRTTFDDQDDVAVQIIHPFRPRPLDVIDVPSRGVRNIADALRQEQTILFDLKSNPGWRRSVFRLGPKDHVLSIVLHHIISDGWSVDILRQELGLFYSAALRGQSPLSQVAPLPIQYRHFSIWQRQEEQAAEHERQLEYWVDKLDGSQPAELLCDKPRPALPSGAGGYQEFNINGSLYDDLNRFCAVHKVTPFITLLTAFRIAHYRLTGIRDATMGTVLANRNRRELEGLIGFFANMQCIRIKVEDQSFEEVMRTVESNVVGALVNQDVPFEKIVSKLQRGRDMSRNPLVQMAFVVHSQQDIGRFGLEGVQMEDLNPSPSVRFDIEFHLYPTKDGFEGGITYAEELYVPETINTTLSVFRSVLRYALSQPSAFSDSIPLVDGCPTLSPMSSYQTNWTNYPRDSSLIEEFQKQVIACPDRTAVKDTSTQLTYRELDYQSNHVAFCLAQRSFPAETPVGVFANRSCETIVVFLGILKANLAYLPLDVNTPISRIEAILGSLSDCRLVLLGRDVQAPDLKMEQITLARIQDVINKPIVVRHLCIPPSATSLAYIMFTSGSTGKPKGVLVEHRGIVRLVKQTNVVSESEAARPVAHMTTIAFDVSALEIYGALLNGGTLICIDKTTVLNYKALGDTFRREGVQTAMISTALFKQCLRESPDTIGALDTLFVAGDRFDPQDLARARPLVKSKICNAYGPTENSVLSTVYCIPETEKCINGVPIGEPVSNSTAFVMDKQMQLVPSGVIGELVVSGDGLARGYTDTQLNADRFVSVKLGKEIVRAYRTGDLVRQRPSDKQLEHFGRIDHQVKIRGNRVELAEIDSALLQHSFVHDAATLIRKQEGQEMGLVSFVTINETCDLSQPLGLPRSQDETDRLKRWKNQKIEMKLRKALSDQLPSYMVPAVIQVLDQLPISNTGKTDRQALGRMADLAVPSQMTLSKEQPRNDLERAISEEFARVLGIDIGISDSFFDFGGHSLAAATIISRLNRRLRTELKIGDIFESPTIFHLAERVRSSKHVGEPTIKGPSLRPYSLLDYDLSCLTSLELAQVGLSSKDDVLDIFPVTDLQEWFLNQWTLTSFCYLITGEVDVDRLQKACLAVVQKHSSLRTVFAKLRGKTVQIVRQKPENHFSHSSTNQPLKVASEAFCKLGNCRSLVSGQLHARFALISQSEKQHSFIIQLSHAQYDGFSLPSLFADINDAYGGDSLLVPDVTPFSHYVYTCAQRRSPDVLKFWKDYLQGASLTTLHRPSLSINSDVAEVTGKAVGDLPTPPPGITFPTLVNAAFSFILAGLVGHQDVTFGLVINNRDVLAEGAETILGPCINRVPMRVQLQRDGTVHELCQYLHKQYAHISKYSHVEFPDIVSECTNWPSGSELGCLVNHLHGDFDSLFSLNGTQTKLLSSDVRISLPNSLLIRSIVKEKEWEIQVLTSSRLMTTVEATSLASTIVNTGEMFSRSPQISLRSLETL